MTDAPDLIVPAVYRTTKRFSDPDIESAFAAAVAQDTEFLETVGAIVAGGNLNPGPAPHTAYLQSAINTAAAAGNRTLIIPPLDRADLSAAWILDGELIVPAGMRIDARAATIAQTVLNRAAFYVPPYVDDVSIDVGLCYLKYPSGVRPAMADFTTETRYGASAIASGSGILSFGSRGRFRGRFRGFRAGVRLGNWSGTGTATDGMRESNSVDIICDEVDFGLIYFGQKGMAALVRGSYVLTVGSGDPSHLVYATGASDDCHVDGIAWDGSGGPAFIFKQQKNLTSSYLHADNCPGVLSESDPRGPLTFGTVAGTNMLQQVDGSLVEAVRGAIINGGAGPKSIATLRLGIADGVATTLLRACSLDDDWTIGQLEITYNTADVSTTQTLVHVYGTRAQIGQVKIRNTGVGGVQGIRFTTGSRHSLTAPPVMDGVSNGVVVDPGVTDSVFAIEGAAIRAVTGSVLVFAPDASNIIAGSTGERPYRTNRWYGTPEGPALANITLTQDRLCCVPVTVRRTVTVARLALSVNVAVAAATIRMGIYLDSGTGAPGSLLAEGTILDASTVGAKESTFASNTVLRPGTYWFAYVAQGAAGVQVRGFPGTVTTSPAVDAATALSGATVITDAVTGALPASFGTPGSSPVGPARLAYYVP